MTESEILLGLPGFQITDIQRKEGALLRNKGWIHRTVRHEDWGLRHCVLDVQVPKSKCLNCGRYSRQPLPGILRCQRASEAFQKAIYRIRPVNPSSGF